MHDGREILDERRRLHFATLVGLVLLALPADVQAKCPEAATEWSIKDCSADVIGKWRPQGAKDDKDTIEIDVEEGKFTYQGKHKDWVQDIILPPNVLKFYRR